MPRLIWALPALRDVRRLYRFLAEKNADAARRAVKVMREGKQSLQTRHLIRAELQSLRGVHPRDCSRHPRAGGKCFTTAKLVIQCAYFGPS
ncbi:MAG: type II toxin-antitoxin system RelE/ParE family toxin [Metallibacterium sp.]